jgi:uncharacterized membrane protein YeaQ/YmgE (transglycosylase-associated protein family)
MELHFTGVIIAVCTFLIIGLCHPLVIKQEYYSGTKYWWVYLVIGLVCVSLAFIVPNWFESETTGIVISSILGVTGASFLWGIGELFAQKKRVQKGWFPMNPKRKHEYDGITDDESLCPVCKDKVKHPASYKH